MRLTERLHQEYARMFRTETESKQANARQVLDWMSQPYHRKFVEWLDREASKPLDINRDPTLMIQSAVRANVFREVREHIARLERFASDARTQGELDAG